MSAVCKFLRTISRAINLWMSGRGSCVYTRSWYAARMLCLGRSINMRRGEFVMITIVGDVVDRGYEWWWTRGRKYGVVVAIFLKGRKKWRIIFDDNLYSLCRCNDIVITGWSRLWTNVWKKMLIERYMDLLSLVKRFLKYLNYCYLVIINLDQVKYLGGGGILSCHCNL